MRHCPEYDSTFHTLLHFISCSDRILIVHRGCGKLLWVLNNSACRHLKTPFLRQSALAPSDVFSLGRLILHALLTGLALTAQVSTATTADHFTSTVAAHFTDDSLDIIISLDFGVEI